MISSADLPNTTQSDDTVRAKLAELDALVARAASLADDLRKETEAGSRQGSSEMTKTATSPTRSPIVKPPVQAGERQRQLEHRLEERTNEVATLTLLVRDLEADAAIAAENQQWLQQVALLGLSASDWSGLMPVGLRKAKLRRRLARRQLFDGAEYLRQYPDVAAEGMDPLEHYLLHGMLEGRQR